MAAPQLEIVDRTRGGNVESGECRIETRRWATTRSSGDLPSLWRRASLSWNSIRMSRMCATGLSSQVWRRRLPARVTRWMTRFGPAAPGSVCGSEPGIDQAVERPVHEWPPHRDHTPDLGSGFK